MDADAAIAYAAGLFEGEGTVTRLGINRCTIAISMTDREPLERFMAAVGVGKIYGPYAYRGEGREHHKHHWKWSVSDKIGVLHVRDRLIPWLSPRRVAQFQEMTSRLHLVQPRIVRAY